ncbi:MAG: EAL domain-containing protein [Geminicoccaceae bacterium]
MDMIDKAKRRLTVESRAGASPLSSLLKTWLDHDISMAMEMSRSVAIFIVQIDDFQRLVTECGDEAMQMVMAKLGSRLKKTLRTVDASVRSSDDCFTIIHPFDGDPLALHGMAKTMLQRLQQPVRLVEGSRCFAASIGIASYPEDGNSAELLLARAQEALRRTDRWGGNGFCLSSRSAARNVADELSEHEELRRALDADDLTMRFQPILDLPRNCMTAVSAEPYWQHPMLGLKGGEEIASIAGRARLESQLNEWTVDSLCRQLIDWRGVGLDRSISIDVSRSQISDSRLVLLLSDRLSAPGLIADLLEIRLDHDALLAETDHRLRTGLDHLADLGTSLSLSNVGRGPLAVQSLRNLPFHTVCLAPDMIAAIGRCSSAETMLQAMIGFMHDLGLCVRAVDVRYQEQVDLLKEYGCDEATGPFFAPALKSVDIDRLTDFSPCIGKRENIVLLPQQMSMH